ncbi:gamma carbonic anhydrase family protein [Streptomyces gobiensis]|uniref:gamma carbonic anhydrase family protein n=1 Tax=Streptomyces gobiensis TaxID=2875706 RepID=UPI001E30F1AD|nr:gamma carbonic anhydrase family protein [Streptomyces gobiensis]UGY94512.1 gamma carbonic anhydrase family protein [Streptomyces gobiensis]
MPVYALGHLEPQIHPDAYVHPDATVIGDVRLGAYASVWPQAVLRADDGRVEVGARTNIQDGSVIHAAPETPAVIGSGTVVGHCVHIEGARVGDGCLIASGSVVLNSTVVEDRAMVAAGAVITFDGRVPTGHIAMGVPAKNRENTMFPIESVTEIVEDYVKAAQRFRTGLRRMA